MSNITHGIFDPKLFESNQCSKKLKLLMVTACLVAVKSPRRAELFELALEEGIAQEELIEATSIGFLMGASQLIQSYKSILYSSIKSYLKEEIQPDEVDEFFTQKNKEVQIGFSEFYSAVYRAGVINGKDKQLIAVAVSVALNCATCQDSHIMKAWKEHACDSEIKEAEKIGKYILASEFLFRNE